jgi:acetoin utilization deacetylase AcuC-like enzyme
VLTISIHQHGCFPPGGGMADDMGEGAGKGANINIPLLAGGGHAAYLAAFDRVVLPALHRFRPELIIVASGLDANGFDPLARIQATSETLRAMTTRIMAAADDLCGGRLVMVHEGGYAEAVVPFCGLAIVETLAGHRTEVVDPFLAISQAQQPPAVFDDLQIAQLDGLRTALGL